MSKKTNKQFLKELRRINPDVEPLEEYTEYDTKILCRCEICGNEWKITPNKLLHNRGCPICAIKNRADNQRKTNEQFLKELKAINQAVEPLEEYVNNRTKIKVKCLKCNHIWEPTPDRLINKKRGCPICAIEKIKSKQRKPEKEFLDELKIVNPYIKVLTNYINMNTKIKCKCLICGNEWEVLPMNILHNKSGCPNLCLKEKHSSDEELSFLGDIVNYIKTFSQYDNLKYTIEKGRYFSSGIKKQCQQSDIYFPILNIGIEYDGVYWHSSKKKDINYQLDKKEIFENLGIDVIFVRSDEYVYQTDKLLSRLASKLKLYKKKGYSKKLIVDELSKKEVSEFLDNNYLGKEHYYEINKALKTKNGVTVALLTAKIENNICKLVDLCFRKECLIIGGFQRLLYHIEKEAKEKYNCNKTIVELDRRYNSYLDNIAKKNNFELLEITNPKYTLVKKDVFIEEDEAKNYNQNMFLKIYDSGNLVYYREMK